MFAACLVLGIIFAATGSRSGYILIMVALAMSYGS